MPILTKTPQAGAQYTFLVYHNSNQMKRGNLPLSRSGPENSPKSAGDGGGKPKTFELSLLPTAFLNVVM
ncbi:hypothetical protein [Oscillibacter sp.]|uniref:hypothetical protein n=1 Tax=Oscillibacter sp. TaxID=1945593 RepID=UPI00289FF02B|nr:hypothetical protein [Oscillibacter sp.]